MDSKVIQGKKMLFEVSYIRPLIIFLLVFMHSFTKIAKGGMHAQEFQLIDLYQWIIEFIKGFRIETIALVAGYVFAYQSIDLNRKYSFGPFVKKKFLRLIVPMLFFGTVYYFLFLFDPEAFSLFPLATKLLSGCGHLWFLPMLFWCFIMIWVVDHFSLSSPWLLFALAILAIMPTLPLPFGFSHLPHFLFYVYSGYFIWEHRLEIMKNCLNSKVIIALVVIYILLVLLNHFYTPQFGVTKIEKGLSLLCNNSIELGRTCAGVFAIYLLFYKYTNKAHFKPSPIVVEASGICYGVYVFHQFILVYLYHYTPLVKYGGEIFTPWLGLLISLSLSILLTKIFLKTKFGRFLIG